MSDSDGSRILLKSRVESGQDWRRTERYGIAREKPILSSRTKKAMGNNNVWFYSETSDSFVIAICVVSFPGVTLLVREKLTNHIWLFERL